MEPIEFIKTIFGDAGTTEPAFLCIVTKNDDGELSNQKFFEYPTQLKTIEKYLNLRTDEDVFFSPVLFSIPTRSKVTARITPVLYADTDMFNPAEFYVQPSINVVTGEPNGIKHTHSYWLLDRDDYSKEKIEGINHAIANAHSWTDLKGNQAGVDTSGWNLGKLLRVPGTLNTKGTDLRSEEYEKYQERGYTQDYNVYVDSTGSGTVYALDDIAKAYNPDEAIQKSIATGTPMPSVLPDKVDVLRRVSAIPKLSQQLTREPRGKEDWSELMYALISALLRARFTPEEALVIAWDAPYNKYKRDGRPKNHLWEYDITSASNDPENAPRAQVDAEAADVPIPQSKTAEEFALELQSVIFHGEEKDHLTRTFVDDYLDWAHTRTDAPDAFHIASALAILSCIFGEWGYFKPQWGPENLGLFFSVLAETTESRKTTTRKLMLEILRQTQVGQYDYVFTSDSTAESMSTALATRGNQSSLYHRDEAQELIGQVKGAKQYMKGFLEYLNKLYDGWSEGRLRKDVQTADTPVNFIQYLMGIRTQTAEQLELGDFASGWGPRNIFVLALDENTKTRENSKPRQGVADGTSVDKLKLNLVRRLTDARNYWAQRVGARETPMMIPFEDDAWDRITDLEWDLKDHFANHPRIDVLRPCFVRLGINLMKVSVLFAMADQRDKVVMQDVINALYYAVKWVENLLIMVDSVAASAMQRELDALEKYIIDNDGLVTWSKALTWGMRRGILRKDLLEMATILQEQAIIEIVDDAKNRKSLMLK